MTPVSRLLVFSNPMAGNSTVKLRRNVKGLPFHQWAHINIQFILVDEFAGDVSLTVAGNSYQLSYDSSERIFNLCGGDSADNVGSWDLNIAHTQPELEMEIRLEGRIGVKSLSVDVGTCPRGCLECDSPSRCQICAENRLHNSTDLSCYCDSQ